MKKVSYIYILFLFILLLPILFKLTGINIQLEKKESSENRAMAALPEFKWDALDAFKELYEMYYNDHFPFRNNMVDLFDRSKVELLKESPVPEKAIIGKNGWFYTTEKELQTYQGVNRFTDADLFQIKSELEKRNQYLKSKSCSLYIFILPTKLDVYSENLQHPIKKYSSETRGAQVASFLQKNSAINVNYMLPVFLKEKEKSKEPLYMLTDNHWNDYGTYIGYRFIMESLKKDFPELDIIDESDIEFKDSILIGNVAMMMGVHSIYKEYTTRAIVKNSVVSEGKRFDYPTPADFPYPWDFEIQRETKDTTKPKLLLIRDSFGLRLIPLMSESFKRSTYVFDGWKHRLNANIVESENPDIMVYVIFEPFLDNFLHP